MFLPTCSVVEREHSEHGVLNSLLYYFLMSLGALMKNRMLAWLPASGPCFLNRTVRYELTGLKSKAGGISFRRILTVILFKYIWKVCSPA